MTSKLSHIAHDKLESLLSSHDSARIADVSSMLNDMPPADVAHLLESSTPKLRSILWQLVDTEIEGQDEQDAWEALSTLINNRFNEPE